MSYALAIQPLLIGSPVFPLGTGMRVEDVAGHTSSFGPTYEGCEVVEPYGGTFETGQIVQLVASQNLYSFDYFEVWAPNVVYISSNCYATAFGFVASYDPRTYVILNDTGSIVGHLDGQQRGIVARYR